MSVDPSISQAEQGEASALSAQAGIGSFLQAAREKQGLSLEQVASLTRIQEKFLRALEAEDYEGLPEQVFTRGFVRTYARSVGVAEDEALQRFSHSSRDFYQQGQQEQHLVRLQIQEENRGQLNKKLVIIGSILLLVALGFFLPFDEFESAPPAVDEPAAPVSPESRDLPDEPVVVPAVDATEEEPASAAESDVEPAEPEPSAPVQTSEVPPPPVQASSPETSSEATTEAPASGSAPAAPITPTAETQDRAVRPQSIIAAAPLERELVESPVPVALAPTDTAPAHLQIEATQLTWVVVKSDQASPQEALLQPGQQANWEAQEQFTLTLGNAAGVVVRLNGRSQGPFGKPGEVVREIVLKP